MEPIDNDELRDIIEWYKTITPFSEVRHRQILTFGTDSDRVLLTLFVRFGQFVENLGGR